MNTRAVSQPVQAMVISAIVLATLSGAFILAINDRNLNPIGLPNLIGTAVAVVAHTPIGTQVAPPGASTPIATGTSTPTPTPTPTPVCPQPPADWVLVEFNQSQISLISFAQLYNTTYERLIEVNCLDKVQLQAIQQLYVPATTLVIAPTPFVPNCAPPLSWVSYIVQWGDTLGSLSGRYGVSIEVLMRHNCLTSTTIYAGRRLYVPFMLPLPPTWTPLPTWTPFPTWTPLPTWTPTPTPIMVTPSDTPVPSLTWTPTPTDTPEPPVTSTVEVPTETPPTLSPPPTETPPVSPLGTPAP